jgi:hypothetical protein
MAADSELRELAAFPGKVVEKALRKPFRRRAILAEHRVIYAA